MDKSKKICLPNIYSTSTRVYKHVTSHRGADRKVLAYEETHVQVPDFFEMSEISDLMKKRSRFKPLMTLMQKINAVKNEDGIKTRFYISGDKITDAYWAMFYILAELGHYGENVYKYFDCDDDSAQGSFRSLFEEEDDEIYACKAEDDEDCDMDEPRDPLWKSGDYPIYALKGNLSDDIEREKFAQSVLNEKFPIAFVLDFRRGEDGYSQRRGFGFNPFGFEDYGGGAVKTTHDFLLLNGFKYIHIPKIEDDELAKLFKATLENVRLKISPNIKHEVLFRDYEQLFDSEYDLPNIADTLFEHKLLNADKSAVKYKDFVEAFKKVSHSAQEVKKKEKNPWDELNDLIGNETQKTELRKMVDSLLLEKRRAEFGLPKGTSTLHSVFFGAPGTSKTTVARLVARIMKYEGIISENNFKECKKSDIVGQYVGHTAANVDSIFAGLAYSGGGVLFLDEAYTYTQDQTSFDKEAINCIVQNMENYREIMVIFAGYKEPMQQFLESNAGIRSRIGFLFDFPGYNSEEMTAIAKYQAKYMGYELPDSFDKPITDYFTKLKKIQGESFGNGREARKLVEAAAMEMASRITRTKRKPTKADVRKITPEDLSNAMKNAIKREAMIQNRKGAIGF